MFYSARSVNGTNRRKAQWLRSQVRIYQNEKWGPQPDQYTRKRIRKPWASKLFISLTQIPIQLFSRADLLYFLYYYNLYDLDLNSSDDVTLENMREQAQSYRKQNQVRRKQCCFAGPFFRSQSAWGFGSGSRCNSGSQILNF